MSPMRLSFAAIVVNTIQNAGKADDTAAEATHQQTSTATSSYEFTLTGNLLATGMGNAALVVRIR